MDRITLRLSPDLTRRFDAAAAGHGGRSRLLRRLMEGAAQAPLPTPGEGPPMARSGKLTLRLGGADLRLLELEAAAMGSRTQWSAALIRRRLHDRPQFSRPEALALIEVRRELRRIGRSCKPGEKGSPARFATGPSRPRRRRAGREA